MPNKFLNGKGIPIKKQKYRLSNWSDYNEALKGFGPDPGKKGLYLT